jgi:hypothetical protein
MVLNSLGGLEPEITSLEINQFLNVTPPLNSLQLGQIISLIKARRDADVPIIDCSGLDPQTYISALAAYIESGYLALLVLVFTTAGTDEHVVTVFGHTRNSDQWHPQAIPAYGGPRSATYYSGSAWISHFLIHDDNFGPYYTLSSRALDANPDVRAHWIIPVVPEMPAIAPHLAEVVAAVTLSNNMSALSPLAQGRWFDYLTRTQWKYVLRTLLVERDKYMEHLRGLIAHDGTKMTDAEIDAFASLPNRLWMVEFSLPALFTGNRSKLGEVLIDSQMPRTTTNEYDIAGLRLPNLLFVPDDKGVFAAHSSSMTSHASIYRVREHGQEW